MYLLIGTRRNDTLSIPVFEYGAVYVESTPSRTVLLFPE